MKTLADNHISKLARHGRGGDTQMRFVGGELSHVNDREAKQIDSLGELGEYLTMQKGSGTINPSTGRREYVIEPVTASLLIAGTTLLAQAGWNWATGAKEKKEKQAQSQLQLDLISGQEKANKEATGIAGEAYVAGQQVAGMNLDTQLENQALETGLTKETLMEGWGNKLSTLNLSGSGTMQKGLRNAYRKISMGFEKGKDSLLGAYADQMGSMAGAFESERGRLRADSMRLAAERKHHQEVVDG